MKERIKVGIANLKPLPGVYLMHDKDENIIYIGKAKDLSKRVRQYFLRPQSGKVAKMVFETAYFETIITNNEKEALILEMNLIQTHYPKYNVLLKDDSHYPYIALKKEGYPYLQIKRNTKDKKYDYFGPFPRSSSAYETIDLLNKIFPLRKCNRIPRKPCLYYDLGQCLAPCINKIDEPLIKEMKEQVKDFLKSNNQKVIADLNKKMMMASENLDYEKAHEYKKILEAINHINIKQNIEQIDKKDRDIFAFSSREGYLSLAVLLFRKGRLLDKKSYIVEQFDNNEEQVANLILQFYQKVLLPQEIVINNDTVIDLLEGLIDAKIYSVTRGKLIDLLLSAKQNADSAMDEYFLSAKLDDNKLTLLEQLGKLLNIKTPLRIDLIDNSHLQGSSPVGAAVVFINGEPAKKLYRKYKIEHEEARDDLKSMEEIVIRRYLRMKNEKQTLPDLLLVDGGHNQIHAADKALKEIDLDIHLFGLVKNTKHQTSGLMDKDGKVYEIENNNLFFLLTRMQDEVHRFAISFHQSLRSKKMKSSLLDDIKGLGEKRKEIIHKAYPDIHLLKQAPLEELNQLLPPSVAKALYRKLHD
ncbi:MAG TPA: excinuclease ABC subunit C [Erysipelotrichaceae bacterium]|nr:excinuclease ABC subunit C [Erysipelotrichaceae bacterium]